MIATTIQPYHLNKLDDMFLEYIRERHVRIQARLQELIDSNGIRVNLSEVDLNKPEEAKNVLKEMGVELIQETHTHTFPHTEIWKIKKDGEVVGSFKVDQYGIVTDI